MGVVINVLGNDTLGSPAATISAVTNGARGTAVIASGQIKYTPTTLNYNGTDSFTYRIGNIAGVSTAIVTVTINPVNDAPVASTQSAL